MGIFRRKENKSGRHRGTGRPDDATQTEPDEAAPDEPAVDEPVVDDEVGQPGEPEAVEAEPTQRDAGSDLPEEPAVTHPHEPIDRSDGPFDESEVDDRGGRLDLGCLWLPGRPGMELRVEIDQETQAIIAVTAALGDSAVQLQAFAAPKSSGLWDEVRREIADSIVAQGGTAEEVDGQLGAELQTRMPGRGRDGRTVFSPVRFIGVDGPRWFLRGVLSGPAGSDADASAELIELVKQTVVVRGADAMAPRELLALQLPTEVTEQPDEDAEAEDDDAAPQADDLNPFERGPEITETR